VINMMSLGKKGHKRVNYFSANWIVREVRADGSVLLHSTSKHISPVVVPADKTYLINMGWKQ